MLSVINTALRDCYGDFAELVAAEQVDGEEIISRLAAIGYFYDSASNSFR